MSDELQVTNNGKDVVVVVGEVVALAIDPATTVEVAKLMLDEAEKLLRQGPGNGEALVCPPK